ncbi:hypothetical protein CR513_16415, partial [Mucuna pruriens]
MEECFVVVLKKFPPKLKDSSCFTISCSMNNSHFDKALCDLGASINLMSYFEPQETLNHTRSPSKNDERSINDHTSLT